MAVCGVNLSMAFTLRNYGALLTALSQRMGVDVNYSQPEIVSGSVCPPPSHIYPGTVCYMVSISIDGQIFRGFGPKPMVARQYAEYEAYCALCLKYKMSDMTTEFTVHHYQNKPPFLLENDESLNVDCYFESRGEMVACSHTFRDHNQSAIKEAQSRTSTFEPAHATDEYMMFNSLLEIDQFSEIPQPSSSSKLIFSHDHLYVTSDIDMDKTCRNIDASQDLEDPIKAVLKLARERNLTVSYEISCIGPPHARQVRYNLWKRVWVSWC